MVPLGKVPTPFLEELRAYYETTRQLKIELLPEARLDNRVVDFWRRQLVAEELVAFMQRSYPKQTNNPNVLLIGITTSDMFIRAFDWKFAFAYRQDGRFVVVSTARMDPENYLEPPNPELLRTRVRKMISKSLGLLYYRLPESKDPRSVLYGPILGLDDLGMIGEEF